MELLPEILDRANRYIRSYAMGPKNLSELNILHEWLKLYLMLGNPERLNEAFASQWIAMCWDREFQNDPDLRIRLKSHSDSLLKELIKHPNQAAALDSTSISLARQQLRNIPLGQQVYTHLKSEALADPSYDFRLIDVLPPLGHEVFTTKQGAQPISELTIPGFFTKNGYSAFFEKQGLNLVHRALKEDWVLGRYSGTADETARLYNDLQKLYFAEYERKWQDLIGSLAIVKPRGIAETIQILDSISGPDTPLRPLLEAVAENTFLTRKTEEQVTEDSSGEKSDAISDPAAKAMEAWTEETSPQMVSYLESRFRPLNKLVVPQGEAPAPLDRVLERLNLIRDSLLQMTTAASTDRQALTIAGERMSGQGAMNSIEAVKMEFERLPEPVKSWLLSLTASGWEVTLGSAKTELNKIWKTGVLQNYQKSLDQRYPLFIDSRHDANMQDFTRFFAPGGLIDRFFDENLKPFVDTTRPTWQVLSINRKSINLPKMVLKQFQLAAEIRDAFFAMGGPSPSIEFELKPIRMDANVDTFWLNIEGQKIHYRHGPALSSRFTWPGPRPSDGVRITFRALDGRETTQQEDGSWALFRAFEQANLTGMGVRDRFQLTFQVGGHHALYELRASSVNNPFGLTSLHQFRCPERL
jgi:type VI secretion system protein ImpL